MSGFTRVSNFGDDTVTEIVSSNLVSFLDWGFINIGAYRNVTNGVVDAAGIDYSVLKHIDVEDEISGTVWQAQRMNWVWESGLEVGTPNAITGVTVNGTFYATNTVGDYAHHYDYVNGNVVFDSAISLSSTVTVNYSYKIVKVQTVDEESLFARIQTETQGQSTNFNSDGKDAYGNYGTSRKQLPWVGVELPTREFVSGVGLGNTQGHNQISVIFHVMSENKSNIIKISDIIKNQDRRRIYIYDSNLIAADDAYPLDYRNMLKTGAKMYPELIDTAANNGYRMTSYLGSTMRFIDIGSNQPTQRLGRKLFYKPVRMGIEVIF